MNDLTEGQRAVLQPPYANRLDREQIEDDGGLVTESRAENKRKWDQLIFNNAYF